MAELRADRQFFTDKSEFGGAGRSDKSGGVTLYRTQPPDDEETDKSEFEGLG
jgi:hypothetical protein